MSKHFIAAAALVLACVVSLGAEETGGDFFSTRESIVRTYGSFPSPELTRLYHQTAARYRETGVLGLLYRQTAFAELARLYGERDNALLQGLAAGRRDRRFVLYCIEALRARGTLTQNIPAILAAVNSLDAKGHAEAIEALGSAYRWSEAPEEIVSEVIKELERELSTESLIEFARTLFSWGRREEAEWLLSRRATSGRLADEEFVALLDELVGFGARDAARRLAGDAFAQRLPAPTGEPATIKELYADRLGKLSPLIAIADSSGAWDLLYEEVASRSRRSGSGLIDVAVLHEAMSNYGERAETLWAVYQARKDAEAAGLYGGALIEAGDAYLAQGTLLSAFVDVPNRDDDPYLDLFDALIVLRDPQTVLQAAALYANLFPEPQVARMMSEYVRVLGDFRTSDRLFASFIMSSGLGPDTRFNWEGGRLLAEYYLDTGRVEDGKAAGLKALDQLITVQGAKEMTHSAQPEKFVALFDRFNGVGEMLDYVSGRRKDLPDSTLVALMEQEALERLGRWDDALAIVRELHKSGKPAERAAFLAETNARAGRVEAAIKLFEEVVNTDAGAPRSIHQRLLGLYKSAGRWSDAEKLLYKILEEDNLSSWVYIGGFLADAGQEQAAGRYFARVADVSKEASAAQVGVAVRFFVDARDHVKAADILASRVLLETSFGSKYEFVRECMPEKASECPDYLRFGETLEGGVLGTDHRLLSAFFGLLSNRAGRLGCYEVSLAAIQGASRQAPEFLDNQLQTAGVAAGTNPADAEGALESAVEILPAPAVRLRLADVRFRLGRAESAGRLLGELAREPLAKSILFELAEVLSKSKAGADIAGDVLAQANETLPWTVRAKMVEAAAANGEDEKVLAQAKRIVENGTYVGRALWAVDFFSKRGAYSEALSALALFKARIGDHPALLVADFDVARRLGNVSGAADVASSAAKRMFRPQFSALFRMEAARIAAVKSGVLTKGN